MECLHTTHAQFKKNNTNGSSEREWQLTVLVTSLDSPGSTPKTHGVETELPAASCPLMSTHAMSCMCRCPYTHTCTCMSMNTYTNKIKKNICKRNKEATSYGTSVAVYLLWLCWVSLWLFYEGQARPTKANGPELTWCRQSLRQLHASDHRHRISSITICILHFCFADSLSCRPGCHSPT